MTEEKERINDNPLEFGSEMNDPVASESAPESVNSESKSEEIDQQDPAVPESEVQEEEIQPEEVQSEELQPDEEVESVEPAEPVSEEETEEEPELESEQEDVNEEEAPADEMTQETDADEAEVDGESEEAAPEDITVTETEAATNEEPEQGDEVDKFGKRKEKPYHKRYYLLYGRKEEAPEMDYKGTASFLRKIGFDGGELRQARLGKEYSENIRLQEQKDNTSTYCAYCGKFISGVDFFRLPDGRLRCTTCSRTLVKTKDELKSIYERILANLETFFGASIRVPINIEMLEERKLKKKAKLSIGEIDDQSILILGMAVKEKKNYSIYLENGAPRLGVIATFAHELTHIWQYTHWDENKGFQKCPKSKRLVLYEGMAKWVEIQYLYLIGEKAAAKREELRTRERKDEYGIGFQIYAREYPISEELLNCEKSPFTQDKYPVGV